MYIIGEEEIAALRQVIESQELFRYQRGGESVTEKFEQEFSQKFGGQHTIAMNSGTSALICGLAGMGIGPGDEVIVPAYTFMATALAPLAVGAVPIIAEVDESLTIDPDDLEQKITPRTKAIIPVHMCGLPCNMEKIMEIAGKHNLLVLEDAAQACGGSYHGQLLGRIGRAGAFSFNQYKILSCGDGGALLTDDLELFQRALIQHDGGCVFRDHSFVTVPFFAGMTFRISELQSAVLRVQLTRLDNILTSLRADKRALMDELAGSSLFRFNQIHDADGDCGTTLALRFESAEQAISCVETLAEAGIKAKRPIDTGRHVYSNWEPIMQQHGAHHPGRDGFKLRPDQVSYSEEMCPRTLEILAQTVFLFMTVNRNEEERQQLIRTLKQ